jgi:hypothetical protein
LDPVTPRSAADRLTRLLPGAVHFRTRLWGHTAAFLGDQCVDSAIAHFLLRACSTEAFVNQKVDQPGLEFYRRLQPLG